MKINRSNRRRAIAGVLAGLIFFTMLFTAGLGLIIFSFQSYNTYDQTQAAAIQTAQAKSAESVLLRACDSSANQLAAVKPYAPSTCSGPNVSVWIQDSGSTAVTLVGMWILDSTTGALVTQPTTTPSTTPTFPSTTNPGTAMVIDTGNNLGTANKFTITFITSTGNQFAATYPPPPLVNVVPTITTTLSQTVISPGGSVYDTAFLAGVTGSAAGTVTYSYFSGGACGGSATTVSTVTVTNSVVPNSASRTFNTAGAYSWHAVYSGDANHAAATSACEPLTVGVTISTTLSSPFIVAGGTASDSATLTGATATAGGTVTYFYSSFNTCPNAGATPVPTVPPGGTVINGVAPNSALVTFSSAGAYYWYATYSGDANNPGPVTSTCELLIVQSATSGSKANPTVTTAISAASVIAGTSVTDTATLAGGSGPTGIIVFAAYTAASCTGAATYASNSIIVSGTGPYVSSPAFIPSTVGTYYWQAAYLGDNNNNPYTTACGGNITPPAPPNTETLTVTKATPTIATLLSSAGYIYANGAASDSAALSAPSGTNAGGTVTYSYFSGGACGGSATIVSIVTVTNSVVPSSAFQTFSTVGAYSWSAVFSGDANNLGATSPCEPLTVAAAPACVPSPSNICFASVAQGLGSISLDFASFKYFTVGSCNVGGSVCTLSPWNTGGGVKNNPNLAYGTIGTPLSKGGLQGNHPVFSANITNVDPAQRTIVLDQYSQLLFFDPSSGQQPSGAVYKLVNVNLATHQTQTSTASVTISYGQQVTVFFGILSTGSLGNLGSPPLLSSDFLFFHGTAAGSAFGQNLPWATTLWGA